MDLREIKSARIAALLTKLCLAANLPLLYFILFGPKEGMEELAILFPWLLTGAVHVILVVPALYFALFSRNHRKCAWIYLYFLLFFGLHALYFTQGL